MKILSFTALCIAVLGTGVQSATAQNHMSPDCRRLYQQYRYAESPKAFALAENDSCGYGASSSLGRARNIALDYCINNNGRGCRIISQSAY